MTIEREGELFPVFVAVCDGCGERRILDLEPENEAGEASDGELTDTLEAIGWQRGKPEHQRFNGCFGDSYRETYHHDLCGDCQSGEPAWRPQFGSGRVARPATAGAFANDPCDEWPRALVFAAVGLRPDCGHPRSGIPDRCSWCASGYAIGSTTPGWRR